jgi:hypothetical protein
MLPFGWDGFNNPDMAILQTRPRWWNADAEEALREAIRHWQWAWHYSFGSWFVEHVRSNHQTPAMMFASAKAKKLGLMEALRLPIIGKPCLHCGELFREDAVAGSCLSRFGSIESIDFCNPCMLPVVEQQSAQKRIPESQEVLDWMRDAAKRLQRIPSQSFPSIEEFRASDQVERIDIVALCQTRPSQKYVKELFGSWLGALIAAGLLENGSRRLMRGTQCLARDGHVCYSIGEKTIDDLLTEMQISHEREPRYPSSNLRADFKIGETFVEFLGLKGQPDYDEKTATKKLLCQSGGLQLLLIDPKDLASRALLTRKILRAVRPDSAN